MNDRPAELYDLIFGGVDYAGGAARVHEIIQELNPGAKSLLDVGCGPARHLEHLRRWYEVEGVDLTDVMLDQARRRLPWITFTRGDMRDFDLESRFDTVICLSSAIAYMKTVPELEQAITNMARHLNPGGVLVVEPWDSPEEYVPGADPYVTSYEEPGRKIVMMEIQRLQGNVWLQKSDYSWARLTASSTLPRWARWARSRTPRTWRRSRRRACA